MFNKKKDEIDMNVCEGIEISESIYSRTENRLWTLIIKGLIIYLITAGGVCGLLSASGTTYTPLLVNFVLFTVSMYISCIHYSKKIEDRGNIAFLIVLVFCGFGLSIYINSGFYSMLNDINESAKEYFDYTGIRSYAEPINNRVLAVNIAAIGLGIISVFLVNMWIKRMMYLDAILLSVLMIIYPCYIEREPDLIYMIMLLCGGGLAYVYNRAKHPYNEMKDNVLKIQKQKKNKKRKSEKEKIKDEIKRHRNKNNKKKIIECKEITYTHNYRAFAAVGVQIIIVVTTLILLMQIIIPKQTFHEKDITTVAKELTKERVGTFIRQGFAGFFSRYENIAGLSDGRVGGVGLVDLDYNIDFILKFTPYSEDTLYLKEQEFVEYLPYENRWLDTINSGVYEDMDQYRDEAYIEANSLKDAYDAKDNNTAKGIMELENIGLLNMKFRPYYSPMGNVKKLDDNGEKQRIVYYPRLDTTTVENYKDIDITPYIRYSADNEEALANFCKKVGVNENMDPDKIVAKISTYYQKKYPYTLNPGVTPIKKDFINYFLEEHNKGYCVHFASAATLVLRYLGIPAKYVQGYAVQYDDILRSKILQDKEYEEYYDGYSELGKTGVVEVEVTDASAHAWVEIYDDKYGWKPVEVTPSATGENGGGGNFWNRFMGIFSGGNKKNNNNKNVNKNNNPNRNENKDFLTSTFVRYVVIVVIIIGIILFVIVGFKLFNYNKKYIKANINDRLIIDYSRYIRKKTRKNKFLLEKVNYRQQILYLYKEHLFKISVEENIVEDLIKILEIAGFSNVEITIEEDSLLRSVLGIK